MCSSPTSGPSRPSGSENHLQGRPAICTYKAALRLWPEAPGHGNQVLRYWLRPKDLDPVIASPPHRALPDAYVTAFILRELLELATVEELIAWTGEPALLPRVTFGQYRGVHGTRSRRTTSRGSSTGRSWARTSSTRPGTTVA